ncbi:MAG: ATP-binding protein [Candidatus Hatepunaea meridiana]|nr:ATP-binding protein [Candidatus Hatepunaea meridiana]
MVTFKFPSKIDIADISEFQEQEKQIRECEDEEIDFDFSDIDLVFPFSACFIAKLFDVVIENGQAGKVYLPKRSSILSQFHRIGLDTFLDKKQLIKEESVPNILIQRIISSSNSFTSGLVKLIEEQITLPRWIKESVYFAVHELLLNVDKHCDVQQGNYICINTIPTKRLIHICVLDSGIGILQSFKKNPDYGYLNNDLEAIHKSLEYGVSSIRDTERGIGLNNLLQLVNSNNGEMQIVSGFGMIEVRSGQISNKSLKYSYQGTIVNLYLNIDEGFKPTFNDWEAGYEKWIVL